MQTVNRLARGLSLLILLGAGLGQPAWAAGAADNPPPAETPTVTAPPVGEDGPQTPEGGLPFYPQGCGYIQKGQASTDTPLAITDANAGNTVPGIITSTINLSGLGSSLWNVVVTVHISHTFNADLDIYLISPAGTRVTLTTDNGSGLNNGFANTAFTDLAGRDYPPGPVTLASFTDNVPLVEAAPEQPLAALQGQDPNGNWKLVVKDDAHFDTGTLNSWHVAVRSLTQTPVAETFSQAFEMDSPIPDGLNPIQLGFLVNKLAFISAITLTTEITHPRPSDLTLALIPPDGMSITVASHLTNTVANAFAHTVWSDRAGNNTIGPVTDYVFGGPAAALPPQEPFASQLGQNPEDRWYLSIYDSVPGQAGSVGTVTLGVTAQTCRPHLQVGDYGSANYGRLGTLLPVAVFAENSGALANSAAITAGVSSAVPIESITSGTWSCSLLQPWQARCAHGPLPTGDSDSFSLHLRLPDEPQRLPLMVRLSTVPDDTYQNDTTTIDGVGAFAHSANGMPWDVADRRISAIGASDDGSIINGGQYAFNNWGALIVRVLDNGGAVITQTNDLEGLGLTYAAGGHWSTTHVTATVGVLIARSLWAPPGADWLRYVDTFTNTNPTPRTLLVAWGGTLGYFSQVRVAASADADAVLENTDTWAVVARQASPGTGSLAPPVGFALRSLGDNSYHGPFEVTPYAAITSTVWTQINDSILSHVYQFSVPANGTKRLAYFVYRGLTENQTGPEDCGFYGGCVTPATGSQVDLAKTTVRALVNNPPFCDLSPAERASLVNWPKVIMHCTYLPLVVR